jgi:hypothetical protein
MKGRTKITLRTKIYLTIVALLALTGVLYAANPTPFVFTIPFPTGVAASPDLLLVSEYCSENIDQVDCNGNATLFATLPGFGSGREKYMTIAPSMSANAGFTPRDVFTTEGALVFKIDANTHAVTLFAALGGCVASDHNGITFDHFGTFGNDMIVTCREGNVFRVHGDGTSTLIAGPFGVDIEGPAVVPPGFGPHGGEIWVADEDGNAVHAVKNTNPPGPGPYTVFPNILSHVNPEGVFVIPSPPCAFCDSPPVGPSAFFLAEQQNFQLVWRYPLSDFTGLGGNVIITSEAGIQGADTSLVTVVGNTYVQSSFAPRIPGVNEGSSFVDCDVPTATPTPTPTATSTPTSTPTATATATATPTATATATATPTPTPTPTAVAGCQISTSITSNFNGTPINAGNYIWFTSVLNPSGLGSNPVTFHFTGQTITSANFNLNVPDADVTFDPNVNFATTTFSGGKWVTTVPSSGLPGNTFFSALGYLVPANLPGGINPVTWSGTISTATPGASLKWQWAAAVYTSFSADNNLLGVKPVDANKKNPYLNSDHAGTPENFKQFVIGGARGGGGSNFTGSLSGTETVRCP